MPYPTGTTTRGEIRTASTWKELDVPEAAVRGGGVVAAGTLSAGPRPR